MKIIQDTRERQPWTFDFYPDIEVVRRKLETGDYSIEGFEDILTIDRKRDTGEVAGNIGLEKARFNRELERMLKIKYSHIICEFSIQDVLDFPANSGIPKKNWAGLRVNGKFILKTLYGYEDKYGVTVHFCGNRENAIKKALEVCYFTQKMVEQP